MSLDVKNLAKKFRDKYFWGQHPEAALRYLPVVSEIKSAKLENSRILEIGSGSTGITPYLKRSIVGLDVDFAGPKTSLLEKVKGTAANLPFRKNSFDVVISVDVLEHLPIEDREKAIFEMLKVCKRLAILVVPIGRESEIQDEKLKDYYSKIMREKNKFLDEHVNYGLPNSEEVLVLIDRSLRKLKKGATTRSYKLLNLKIRYFLMKLWITKNKFLYYFYLKGLLPLIPILKYANFSSCYRRIFVIEFVR